MHAERFSGPVRFGPFVIDLDTGELKREGRLVALRPLPTRALLFFVHSQGRLITREDLRRELWGEAAVEWSNGIHQVIRQIRRALGEYGHRFVENVPRRGYRFQASVKPVRPPRRAGRFRDARIFAAGLATPLLGVLFFLLVCCV